MDEKAKISSQEPQDVVSNTEHKKERKSLSYEEKLEELDRKMEQLKARKRDLAARHSKEERKKRTKRLIEVGATVLSFPSPYARGNCPPKQPRAETLHSFFFANHLKNSDIPLPKIGFATYQKYV